jgi:hypothetical protein
MKEWSQEMIIAKNCSCALCESNSNENRPIEDKSAWIVLAANVYVIATSACPIPLNGGGSKEKPTLAPMAFVASIIRKPPSKKLVEQHEPN